MGGQNSLPRTAAVNAAHSVQVDVAAIGPGSRPPARITAAIVAGLGEGAVKVVLSPRMTGGHADPTQREIGAHLSQGLSVLVHLVERTTGARRVLLDAAARHLASAVALVCGADNDAAAAFVAQLASEGWSAGQRTPTLGWRQTCPTNRASSPRQRRPGSV
ncbi:MAG: hypothetical protein M3Z25_08385 [Actinomycetota bacterium]|nr:hypothetical protein [Actinomycetota bacterium]